MPLDLNSNFEPIDYTQQQYQDVLQDLQGNILKGHGRNQAVQIFLTFSNSKDKVKALKLLIAQLAQDITSAKKQIDDANAWRNNKVDAGVFVHFCLSSSGYQKLGLPDSKQPKGLNLQKRQKADQKQLNIDYAEVFQDGMKTRQYALLEPPVSTWEPGFQKEIDALIIIAANNPTDLNNKESEVRQKLKDIATIATIERSNTVRREFKNSPQEKSVVEHFGFTDGIGQPLFLKQDLEREKGEKGKKLFSARLNLVLVPDPFGTPNVSFGSFLVFRKLDQNVQGFKKAEVALGQSLGVSPKLAGAMAVGRFEDGTPLVLQGNDGATNLNDFDYSADPAGLKCPFHAHLRTTNPRNESAREGGPFAQSEEQELGHRIARRGMTYGPLSDFSGNLDNLPKGGVGLLFMCYQSDIWEQFEFIQRFWSNHPRFLEPTMSLSRNVENKNYDRTGLDAVSGQTQPGQRDPVLAAGGVSEVPAAPQNWLTKRDQPTQKTNVNFAQFVTLKGGEYFFSPSISFLKNLPNLPEDFTEPPIQEPIPARTYVVRQGDFLFSIAQRAYGDGNQSRAIYEANQVVIGPDPTVLVPGQILYIPIQPEILQGNTTPIPGQRYVVQSGDFLFLIAARAYGDGNLFTVIYEANRDVIGPDPTVLVPGQVILIPPRP